MMSPQSIIKKTGQAWKLYVFAILLVVGFICTFWGQAHTQDVYGGAVLGIGLFAGLTSLIFPAVAVRCPSCGARWFWLAISEIHKDHWLNTILNFTACPRCNFTGKQSAR